MTISQNFPVTRPSLLLDFSNQTVLDPRVTFTRTTTGYYYDNHSAALGEQNLLLQSNTFTNAAWTVSGLGTPVLNATDPTGTASGAYTLTATATTTGHYIVQSLSGTFPVSNNYTFSIYLQAGAGAGSTTYTTLSLSQGAGTNYASATFNLTSTGSVTQSSANGCTLLGATITQIGSTAWYRCTISLTLNTANSLNPIVQMSSTATPTIGNSGIQASYLALGTETLLVYGAQLEQRSTPTVYTATISAAINTYTPTLQVAPINAPRFDYNPVTRESLGLFTEQQSINLALYSSDVSNAAWAKSNFPITASYGVSPDGTQNASLAVINTTSAFHNFSQTLSYTAAVYTQSIYVKYYGQQFIQIYNLANGLQLCNFDILNGTAGTPSGTGSPTASIVLVGNGWYRCSISFTATVGASIATIFAASNSLTAGQNPVFTGNGFNGYLVWGAQVELAPSATSYIATTTAATTRTVDAASMTGTNFTSWYNYTGGTVYVEAASGFIPPSQNATFFNIGDGTSNNYLEIAVKSTGILSLIRVNTVNLVANAIVPVAATAANTFYKTAFAFSTAGSAVSSVGQTPTTSSTSISAPPFNQLNFQPTFGFSNNPLNGRIKKFAYYPLALTNTQIQSLSAN